MSKKSKTEVVLLSVEMLHVMYWEAKGSHKPKIDRKVQMNFVTYGICQMLYFLRHISFDIYYHIFLRSDEGLTLETSAL